MAADPKITSIAAHLQALETTKDPSMAGFFDNRKHPNAKTSIDKIAAAMTNADNADANGVLKPKAAEAIDQQITDFTKGLDALTTNKNQSPADQKAAAAMSAAVGKIKTDFDGVVKQQQAGTPQATTPQTTTPQTATPQTTPQQPEQITPPQPGQIIVLTDAQVAAINNAVADAQGGLAGLKSNFTKGDSLTKEFNTADANSQVIIKGNQMDVTALNNTLDSLTALSASLGVQAQHDKDTKGLAVAPAPARGAAAVNNNAVSAVAQQAAVNGVIKNVTAKIPKEILATLDRPTADKLATARGTLEGFQNLTIAHDPKNPQSGLTALVAKAMGELPTQKDGVIDPAALTKFVADLDIAGNFAAGLKGSNLAKTGQDAINAADAGIISSDVGTLKTNLQPAATRPGPKTTATAPGK